MKRIFGFITMMLFTLALCVAPAMAADSDTGLSSANDYTVTQAEHQAIVCVRTGDQGATLQAQSADGMSWEPLMDVSGTTTDGVLTTQGTDQTEIMLVKSDSMTTDEIIAAAKARSDVLYAEPDTIYQFKMADTQDVDTSQIVDTSSADYSRFQWGLNNTGLVNKGKVGVDIGNTTGLTGSRSTVIAVMDSGIDYTHPDLQDQMVNLDQYPALEAATSCGKYGYCATGETPSDIYDYLAGATHGTHCAGIIAAAANGSGTNGVMKNVSLMGVRIMNKSGKMSFSAVIKGYEFLIQAKAAGVNVKAVNCSFGASGLINSYEMAIAKAGAAGIVSIYASSNDSQNNDNNVKTSSRTVVNQDCKVVVDNMDSQGIRSESSDYGVMTTDVFAPGQDILSTVGSLNVHFNAFTAALDPSRIVSYNSFEDNGGTADTEKDVDPLTFHTWSDSAADHCGAAVTADTTRPFLGNKSLTVDKSADGSAVTLVTSPKTLSKDASRKLYLNSAVKTDAGICSIAVSYRNTSGGFTEMKSSGHDGVTTLLGASDQWIPILYMELPEDGSVDYTNFQLKFDYNFSGAATQMSMDSFGLGYGLERYGLMTGTSMAAPMAAGEFGLLASAYPDEPVQKIAARVTGGTTDSADLKDLCRSGGYTNTAKAASDPNPAIQKIAVDGQTAVLTGYFFGSQGSVSVGGKDAAVTKWSDTSITVTIPSGLTGMQEFTVTDSTGQHGRDYADVGNAAHSYTDRAVPSGGSYADAAGTMPLVSVGNDIYMVTKNYDDKGELWCYDIKAATWTSKGTTMTTTDGQTVDLAAISAMASCGGKLYALTSDALYQYAPADGKWTKTALKGTLLSGSTLADVNGQLLSFGGADASGVPSTAINAIDPATGKVTAAGAMPAALSSPKVAVSEGTVMILGGTDATGTDNKTVTMTTDLKTYTTGDALPGDASQQVSYAVAPTKTGLIMAGMVHSDGTTWQDTWNFDKSTGKWTASDKVLSANKTFSQVGCQVNGQFYVWGQSYIANDLSFFRSTAIESPEAAPIVTYEVHGRNYGWNQGRKANGATAGTTGQALRLEALKVKIEGEDGSTVSGLGISYQVHVQNTGWMDWKSDGEMAGTTGQSLRMEAVKISLTGTNASKYSVSYRVHVQNKGWTDWVSDGAEAGTTGQGLRAEAIEIKLTAK